MMQLCYRGVEYQAQTYPVQKTKSKAIAKFRGKTYTLSQSIVSTKISSNLLTYRGITYQRGERYSALTHAKPAFTAFRGNNTTITSTSNYSDLPNSIPISIL